MGVTDVGAFVRGHLRGVTPELGVTATVVDADHAALDVYVRSPAGVSAVTVADGAAVTLGAIADAAVTGDISGTVNAHLRGITKQLAGTLTVSGTVATGGLTDAQLRATAVPVSLATVAVTNAGTFAVQATLAAETTKVIGTVNQGTSPWVTSRNWTLASGTDSVSAVQGTAAAVASAWPIKVTDGINTVGIATGTGGASELLTDRMKVNAELRLLDTAQTAGVQLVAAKGDQTSGLWVNTKSSALPTNASIETGGQLQQVAELLQALVIETRIHTLILGQGLNVNDDPAPLRNDPYYLN